MAILRPILITATLFGCVCLTGGLLYLSSRQFFSPPDDCASPKECPLKSSDDMISFNSRLERYFATTDSITAEQWYTALPTVEEVREMQILIRTLFSYDTFEHFDKDEILSQFPLLAKSVTLTVISEHYCVVHEHFPTSSNWLAGSLRGAPPKFPRFWGYFAVASTRWAKRPNLHHSAAHFQSDGEVCAQAAALFQRTRSKSLVVAGASRFAVIGKLTNNCQPKTALADAAHNVATMFHAMNVGVWRAAAETPRPRLLRGDDAYFQWHGMANTSCTASAAFASAGVAQTSGIYDNSSATVNRLVLAVNELLKRKFAHTPATDAKCGLKATTNIFGRVLNGVPVADACWRDADEKDVSGEFIHVEQKGWIGNDWPMWTDALRYVFPPISPTN